MPCCVTITQLFSWSLAPDQKYTDASICQITEVKDVIYANLLLTPQTNIKGSLSHKIKW